MKKGSLIVLRTMVTITFLCSIFCASHLTIAAKEPPVIKYSIPDKSSGLESDYTKLFRTFLESSITASYKTASTGSSVPEADRLSVVGKILDMEACRADIPDHRALLKDAEPIVTQATNDPVFMGCFGALLEMCGEFSRAEVHLNTTLNTPGSSGQTSHSFRFLLQTHLARARFYQGRDKQTLAGEAFRAAQAEIAEAIVTGEFKAEESRIPFRLISDLDQDVMGQIDWAGLWSRIEKTAKIDPWLREMLSGCTKKVDSWAIRGHGFYNQVPADKMQVFNKGIVEAAQHFKSAHDLHPDWPEAAVEMMSSVRANEGCSDKDEWFWFLQAVKAQFDYLRAYREFSHALVPRWGGSIDQMENFADACLETNRFDTIVPFLYIRTFRDIANEMKNTGCRGAFRQDHVRAKVTGLLDNLEKNTVWTDYDKTCLWTQRMLIADWTGDYATARKLLDSLPCRIDLRYGFRSMTLIDNGWTWDQIAAEITAFTGPHAKALIDAENAALKGDAESAATMFRDVMAKSAADPLVHDYLRDRSVMAATGIYNFGDLGLLNNMVYWDHYEQVKFLIDNGYPSDGRMTESWTPLRYAISLKKTGIANLLIERGANLNPSLVLETSYFDMAASTEQWDLALALLKKGAQFDPKSSNRHLIGVIDKKMPELALLMIAKGANVNFAGPEGWTPLLYAINSKLTDVAMTLLDKGAKVDAVTPDGWNALMRSIVNDEAVAIRLIDKGADVNYRMKDGMMPLHLAVKQKSPAILRKLMSKGADPNIS